MSQRCSLSKCHISCIHVRFKTYRSVLYMIVWGIAVLFKIHKYVRFTIDNVPFVVEKASETTYLAYSNTCTVLYRKHIQLTCSPIKFVGPSIAFFLIWGKRVLILCTGAEKNSPDLPHPTPRKAHIYKMFFYFVVLFICWIRVYN